MLFILLPIAYCLMLNPPKKIRPCLAHGTKCAFAVPPSLHGDAPCRFCLITQGLRPESGQAQGCPVRRAARCFQPGQRSLCPQKPDFFPSRPVRPIIMGNGFSVNKNRAKCRPAGRNRRRLRAGQAFQPRQTPSQRFAERGRFLRFAQIILAQGDQVLHGGLQILQAHGH